ncbi:reverse transcriptase [Phytophthora megakarya]|uniref:Reverse transcriptase n=1 Tax=Phytophthora megakarya TaxID=4795 RepID=A0A225V3Z5_9STRA|nr:reverse transcriptase [Phytophthora megakarya]
MIASGNALPPPAYGGVCDINVEDHAPIKQRARRIPIRYLQKLHELLKGLLKANVVSFSDSQWDSPIVIVLKKNGEDIRLCIDYKMANAVIAIMEYAMPLVDDLLTHTDLDSYMWFCSLDAASGFWAIIMTHRARKISAFVCPLGHFEWLRMPFRVKNAPMIYQRMIDNALWGFVQPKGGWRFFAEKMKTAEDIVKSKQVHSAEHSINSWGESPIVNTKFAAARSDVENHDPVLKLVNEPTIVICAGL